MSCARVCVNVCVYVCVWVCVCMCAYNNILVYKYIYLYDNNIRYIHVCMCMCIFTCVCVCMSECVCVCACVITRFLDGSSTGLRWLCRSTDRVTVSAGVLVHRCRCAAPKNQPTGRNGTRAQKRRAGGRLELTTPLRRRAPPNAPRRHRRRRHRRLRAVVPVGRTPGARGRAHEYRDGGIANRRRWTDDRRTG